MNEAIGNAVQGTGQILSAQADVPESELTGLVSMLRHRNQAARGLVGQLDVIVDRLGGPLPAEVGPVSEAPTPNGITNELREELTQYAQLNERAEGLINRLDTLV